MKREKMIFPIIAIVFLFLAAGCGIASQPKTLEKNYGYSYGEVNIGSNETLVLSVEEIVPPKSELCANLKEAGFTIVEYETALNSDVAAERVHAEKDDMFMDICYGLSTGQARELFSNYETAYEEFYLMAQNEYYIYAVSDEETFTTAGFETLETNGILYVWK